MRKKLCFGCGKEFFYLSTPMRCEECLKNKVEIKTSPVKNAYWKISVTKYPFFCGASWSPKHPELGLPREGSGFWFRIYGYGLHFTNEPKLFSERNGHRKFLPLPFGWRMKLLKRETW